MSDFLPDDHAQAAAADAESMCSQEQIHIPGTIQPHGACLVLDPDNGFIVIGASRNAAMLLLAPSASPMVIGASLATVLGARFAEALQGRFQSGRMRGEAPWQSTLSLLDQPLDFNVAVHAHMGLILVELERAHAHDNAGAQATISHLQELIVDLRETGNDLDGLARITARGLRLLTGYERVMVYRFDTEWNGQAIAEDKQSEWDQSFEGVLCPAADIPAQARELYRRSPMRWVADRDARPMPIDIDQAWVRNRSLPHAVDLSFARLRSQSPIHLQIHRDLGINGSMSLSILYNERLWGLMIFHHRQPHYPSCSQQSAAAVLTNAFALRVGPAERTESEQARRKDFAQVSALLVHMAGTSHVREALVTGDVTIGGLFASTGAAVLYDGEISLLGQTPTESDVRQLGVWLRMQGGKARSFQTFNLTAAYPPLAQHVKIASGLLVVFLSSDRSDMLLWFRPEQPRLVSWGGHPPPRESSTAPTPPVLPYERWDEMLHGFAKPWAEWELEVAEALRHDVTEVMVRSLRRTTDINDKLSRSQLLELATQTQIGMAMHQSNEMLKAKLQAQQAQQDIEAEFHFATKVGGFGVWKLQLRTRQLTTSAVCKNNFGRDPDVPFTYDDLFNAIRPGDRDRIEAAMVHSMTKGTSYDVEVPITRPNGTAGWVQMKGQVAYADDGMTVSLVGISLDVTERVLTQERMRQSQKIEAIGRLTAGIAHDFNNVLQALLGGIEIAIDDVADQPSVCADLEIALQAGQRGARLTSHLLSFARQQILCPAQLDLSPLLKNLSGTLMRTLGHDINVRVEIEPDTFYVLADDAHLDSALLNLALNARDAMPHGGELKITAHTKNDNVVITVTDTGEGMSPDVLMQACEPFFSTKGAKGSGLGLSMVQGFAQQSGGELHIQSVLGQGTRIEISLPAAMRPRPSERTGKVAAVQGQGRVLIVDDEPDVGRVTAVFLRKAGFEVVLVTDAKLAVSELRAGLVFNALVTDYAMPGMNGANLVLYARELHPRLPALIITGYASSDELDALPSDITILRKPFQNNDLVLKVKDLIQNEAIADKTRS